MRLPFISWVVALLWIAASADAVRAPRRPGRRARARQDERVGVEAFYQATEFWYRMVRAFGEE